MHNNITDTWGVAPTLAENLSVITETLGRMHKNEGRPNTLSHFVTLRETLPPQVRLEVAPRV